MVVRASRLHRAAETAVPQIRRPPVDGGLFMSSVTVELDFIEELRLRRWARENYVPPEQRKQSWHLIVHEEMEKKDLETGIPLASPVYASGY